jgi:hypothetical protein
MDIRGSVEFVGLAVDLVGVGVIVAAIAVAGVAFARGLTRGEPSTRLIANFGSRLGAASSSGLSSSWRATSSALLPSRQRSPLLVC